MDYFRWLFLSWQGRVNRKLYWSSIAFLCLLPVIPKIFSLLFGFSLWADWFNFYFLCTAGPFVSLVIKRLHDTNRNLLWVLKIIPVFGVILIYFSRLPFVSVSFRQFVDNSGPQEFARYLMFSAFVVFVFFTAEMFSLFNADFDSAIGVKLALGFTVFISSSWAIIYLLFMPGTAGKNRYGPDPIVPDEEHPAIAKINVAIDMIEPWVDQRFPFALSLQSQLEWCQLTLSGLGKEEPKGDLSMVHLAESSFDEWNEKAHLVSLLREIETAAKSSL